MQNNEQNSEKNPTYMDMINELTQKLTNLVQHPKTDIQENFHTLISEGIAKMNLVTQEEFIKYEKTLEDALLRVKQLEKKIDLLEKTTPHKR